MGAFVDGIEKGFVTSLQLDAVRRNARALLVVFVIGKELDETSIPHIIIGVWIRQDRVGSVVHVFHGKHDGTQVVPGSSGKPRT